jgi:CRP-like cAMP-binding protein
MKEHCRILTNTPLFSKLSEQGVKSLCLTAEIKNYAKGDLLFSAEDCAKYFYVISTGFIKLFHTTLDGQEAVINILGQGDLLGEFAIFYENTHLNSAEALEESSILVLSLGDIKQLLEQNNFFALKMLEHMTTINRQNIKELEHRDTQTTTQRIACFFLRLCLPDTESPSTILRLPYNKLIIASRLGMKAETFSRSLERLRHETGITIQGSNIHIKSIEKLHQYACQSCSHSYPCKDLLAGR